MPQQNYNTKYYTIILNTKYYNTEKNATVELEVGTGAIPYHD